MRPRDEGLRNRMILGQGFQGQKALDATRLWLHFYGLLSVICILP